MSRHMIPAAGQQTGPAAGQQTGANAGSFQADPRRGGDRPSRRPSRWKWVWRLVILSLIIGFSWILSGVPSFSKAAGFHLVPVAGTVRLDGKPLALARLVFLPLERDFERALQEVSVATTDADGSFSLSTVDGRIGAARGRHLVFVLPALDPESLQKDDDPGAPIDPWLELQELLDWVRPTPLRQEMNVPIMGTRNLKISLGQAPSRPSGT